MNWTESFIDEASLPIRTANAKGYIDGREGDGVDISSRMEYHRGTVQKQMSHAITTGGGNYEGVIVKNENDGNI